MKRAAPSRIVKRTVVRRKPQTPSAAFVSLEALDADQHNADQNEFYFYHQLTDAICMNNAAKVSDLLQQRNVIIMIRNAIRSSDNDNDVPSLKISSVSSHPHLALERRRIVPLHDACVSGYDEIVRLLLAHDDNIETYRYHYDDNDEHLAKTNNVDSLSPATDTCLGKPVNTCDMHSGTSEKISPSSPPAAPVSVSEPLFDVNAYSSDGTTALHAVLNHLNISGTTCGHISAAASSADVAASFPDHPRLSIVKMLISHGADVNALVMYPSTPPSAVISSPSNAVEIIISLINKHRHLHQQKEDEEYYGEIERQREEKEEEEIHYRNYCILESILHVLVAAGGEIPQYLTHQPLISQSAEPAAFSPSTKTMTSLWQHAFS